MKKLRFIRHGSSKDIYEVDQDTIAFRFTDYFSVFDVGRASYKIPGKGEAVCACACKSFKIAEMIGVPTHFIERIDNTTIRVKKAQIITDRPLTRKDENYVVPAEFIYRLRVAGSIDRDFRSGKKKPEKYGLPRNITIETGTPFPYPVHMLTTKFEKTDREIKVKEVCRMAGITRRDLDEYWSMIDRLTGAIDYELKRKKFGIADGKMEMIMGHGRLKMVGDVFGTPDEDRPFRIVDGKIVHYSKEYLRQIFIRDGYHAILKDARRRGKKDPLIPRLKKEQIEEVASRYHDLMVDYAIAEYIS